MTGVHHRPLGVSGPRVFPLGLGCMGMSDFYGSADETESIATIHAALDAGKPDLGQPDGADISSPHQIGAWFEPAFPSAWPCR